MTGRSLLFTCEHATNAIPEELAFLREALGPDIWETHRAYDIGAIEAGRELASRCGSSVIASTVSRLVVDTNRSEHHPKVFSEPIRALSRAQRESILAFFHRPHREMVATSLRGRMPVLHVAVHSFTPSLDGDERTMDVGLLYDPARGPERELAAEWKRRLNARLPAMRLRRNAPYRGAADGLPTAFRRVFLPDDYAGFELELNQRAFDGAWPPEWLDALAETLRELTSPTSAAD